MDKTQLIRELRIIKTELHKLIQTISIRNSKASNHSLALWQHVSRLIKELENEHQEA